MLGRQEQTTEDDYKAMWNAREPSAISLSAFKEAIQNIKDDAWVIHTCMEAICLAADDQRNFYEYGLDLCFNKLQASDGEWVPLFLKLLRNLELYHTFMTLHPGCFNSEAFQGFRKSPIGKTAVAFARLGNLTALRTLVRRHPFTLHSSWLQALSALPCTLESDEYESLLPTATSLDAPLDGFTSMLTDDLGHQVAESVSRIGEFTDVETLPDCLLVLLSSETQQAAACPMKSEDIVAFYQRRAERIENETGDLEIVRRFLECGIERRIPEPLESMLVSISIFKSWISVAVEFWDWTLAAFEKLSVEDRLQKILKSVTFDTIGDRLEHVFIPLNNELPANEAEMLRGAMLPFVLRKSSNIFQQLIAFEYSTEGLFNTASTSGLTELVHTAIGAVKAVDRITEWDDVYEALEIISRQVTLHGRQLDELSTEVGEMLEDCYLGATLEKYSVHVSYTQMHQLTSEEGLRLARSVLGHGLRMGRRWDDEQWQTLLSDMMTMALRMSHLCQSGFDVEGLKGEYFQTLLRASQFSLADGYWVENVERKAAEEIAWTIGREMLCSVIDMDDASALDEAKSCFDLFPNSERAREEVQKLMGLSALRNTFGMSMLPIELEQMTSKATAVSTLLSHSPKHYKKRTAFLAMTRDLRFTVDEFSTAWTELSTVALAHKDVHKAKEFIQDMCDRDLSHAPSLARELLRVDESQGYLTAEEKKELFKFVIMNCEDRLQDSIEQMEGAWESIDAAPDVDIALTETGLSGHSGAYWYIASESYRLQLRASGAPLDKQRCSIYDFVIGALDSVNNNGPEAADFLSGLLTEAPREIARHLKESPHFLHSTTTECEKVDAFEQHLHLLQQRDHLQTVSQRFHALLPGLDIARFSDVCNEHYRQSIVLELGSYAAELLHRESKTEKWRQALVLALEHGEAFGVSTEQMYLQFLSTLCPLIDGPNDQVQSVVLESEKHLGRDSLKQLLEGSWEEAKNAFSVACLIGIVYRALTAGSETRPLTSILPEYITRILEIHPKAPGFDFRLPIFRQLSSHIHRSLGFEFDWNSPMTELQNLYAAVSDVNYVEIGHLYGLIEIEEGMMMTASVARLVYVIKKLQMTSWKDPLSDEAFWRETVEMLTADSLLAVIEFAVFSDSVLLVAALSILDATVQQWMTSWEAVCESDDERNTALQLLLDQAIRRLRRSGETHIKVEKLELELKKLRRMNAVQKLGGIGVRITGDSLNDNIQSIVRNMIHGHHGYGAIYAAVTDYADRADEPTDASILRETIADVLLLWIEECASEQDCQTLEEILKSVEEGDKEYIQSLQQAIWERIVECVEPSDGAQWTTTIVKELNEILNGRTWQRRQWPISPTCRWKVFSWIVKLKLADLDQSFEKEISCAGFGSLKSVRHFMESQMERDLSMNKICAILDCLTEHQNALGQGVNENWLQEYYYMAFSKAFQSGKHDAALQYICHRYVENLEWERALLSDEHRQRLVSAVQNDSENLATCLGLILSPSALRQKYVDLISTIQGNAETLAVLLSTVPEYELHQLLSSDTWLSRILNNCPPHPSLIDSWIAPETEPLGALSRLKDSPVVGSDEGWDVDEEMDFGANSNRESRSSKQEDGRDVMEHDDDIIQSSEKPTPGPEHTEGWDLDDNLAFDSDGSKEKEGWDLDENVILEEQPTAESKSHSDGWSDMAELETAIEASPPLPAGSGNHGEEKKSKREAPPSDALNTQIKKMPKQESSELCGRDQVVAAACCFSTVMARLAIQGRTDIAADILSRRKFNYHSMADPLNGGTRILQKFLQKMARDQSSAALHISLNETWSKPLLLSLLQNMPSLSNQALPYLNR